MEHYANTCELGAKLDPTARYHAVVCYKNHSSDLADMIADRLRPAGLSVYFDEIGFGYPGCKGNTEYDVAYRLYSKQTNYVVELLSTPPVDFGSAARMNAACWARNGNYLIPVRVSENLQPTEDMVYLDAVLLAFDSVTDALATELVMQPSKSNRARIERFKQLYRQEGEEGEAIVRLLERRQEQERELY